MKQKLILGLVVLSLLFLNLASRAQTPLPTGSPTRNAPSAWDKVGYVQIDRGLMFTNRDTLWKPKFPTVVSWARAGVDTALWFYNGKRWNQVGVGVSTGGVVTGHIHNLNDVMAAGGAFTASRTAALGGFTMFLNGGTVTANTNTVSGAFSNFSVSPTSSFFRANNASGTTEVYSFGQSGVPYSYIRSSAGASVGQVMVTPTNIQFSAGQYIFNSMPTTADNTTYKLVGYNSVTGEARYFPINPISGGSITSVFGRQGVVVAQSGDYTFNQIGDKPTTLLGYGITDAAALSHTHTFGSLTSKPTSLSGYGITDGVAQTRTLTINGVTYDLSANRSWTISTGGTYTATTPIGITGTNIHINDSTGAGGIVTNQRLDSLLQAGVVGFQVAEGLIGVAGVGGDQDTIIVQDGGITNDKIAAASKIGLLANLTTTDKTSIVAAINEVQAEVGSGSAGEANTTSNAGTTTARYGLAMPKVGVNLPLKSLTAGDNITLDTLVSGEIRITGAAGGGGAADLVKVATLSPSGVSTYDVDLTSYIATYTTIEVRFLNVVMGAAANYIRLRVSPDASTFNAGATEYGSTQNNFTAGGAASNVATDHFQIMDRLTATAGYASKTTLTIDHPNSATLFPMIAWNTQRYGWDSAFGRDVGFGYVTTAQITRAIRIYSDQTFTGTIQIWGYK